MPVPNTTDHVRPFCFVLMPFGTKVDPISRLSINFDAIYQGIIRPAIEQADLEPIRADEEQVGGIIHKAMYERLILCEYAVADLTTFNANVYYELGVRHAFRPWSTVLIFADGVRLPFDLGPMRGLPYHLKRNGGPAKPRADQTALAGQLVAARQEAVDSPIFQLLRGLAPSDVSRLDPESFREQVERSRSTREQLAEARGQGAEALRQVLGGLGALRNQDSGVLVELLLSFRAVEAYQEMVELVERMPRGVAASVRVQEQYALALNRVGNGAKAQRVLEKLIADRGASSETYGLLGRVYKDRWDAARREGRTAAARGLLTRAIEEYLKGFQSDWRDYYPGINAVQLMELSEPPDPRRQELLPVVTYSVKRRLESGKPTFWDHATMLELAVLGYDEKQARAALANVVAAVPDQFQPASTLETLRRLREARAARGPVPAWMAEIEQALQDAARPVDHDRA
jgi:tetratricopeptide (TPR) repeat protein